DRAGGRRDRRAQRPKLRRGPRRACAGDSARPARGARGGGAGGAVARGAGGGLRHRLSRQRLRRAGGGLMAANRVLVTLAHIYDREAPYLRRLESAGQIGRASCRERVESWVGWGSE